MDGDVLIKWLDIEKEELSPEVRMKQTGRILLNSTGEGIQVAVIKRASKE